MQSLRTIDLIKRVTQVTQVTQREKGREYCGVPSRQVSDPFVR